jgi:LPXTG-motif cell wall-anchored protein
MGPLRPGSETLGAPISAAIPSDMEMEGEENTSELFGSGNKTKALFLMIGLILLALGGYIYFKSKS